MGTHRPSLSPLSMFRPSRTSFGTALLVTTALPNAASVAASMVPKIAASNRDSLSNRTAAAKVPRKMTPGRPTSNIRDGMRNCFLRTEKSAFAASIKRIRARVRSASSLIPSRETSPSNQPIIIGPMRKPEMTKTMGPDAAARSTRPATRL